MISNYTFTCAMWPTRVSFGARGTLERFVWRREIFASLLTFNECVLENAMEWVKERAEKIVCCFYSSVKLIFSRESFKRSCARVMRNFLSYVCARNRKWGAIVNRMNFIRRPNDRWMRILMDNKCWKLAVRSLMNGNLSQWLCALAANPKIPWSYELMKNCQGNNRSLTLIHI